MGDIDILNCLRANAVGKFPQPRQPSVTIDAPVALSADGSRKDRIDSGHRPALIRFAALSVSTSVLALSVIWIAGTTRAGAQTAPQSALPPVIVGEPGARVRRAQPQRAATSRPAARPRRVAQVQPVRQPPVVSNQDARTGQTGYITRTTSSATRTNTALIDVPQSISVVTKEQIKDQAFQSIGDATRYIPGVILHQGESHRDDLVIRGQRSNADFYRNGIRDDVQYFRDLYNTQRLEFIKGPNALIFGRGGGGGLVNRVLKDADGVTIREFTVGGSSYPGARITADVGQAVTPDLAVRLNA